MVCSTGAGISVQAGIPDFRSSEGLFQTLKRDNPKEALASGKDLFDASVFNVGISAAMPVYFRKQFPYCISFIGHFIDQDVDDRVSLHHSRDNFAHDSPTV